MFTYCNKYHFLGEMKRFFSPSWSFKKEIWGIFFIWRLLNYNVFFLFCCCWWNTKWWLTVFIVRQQTQSRELYFYLERCHVKHSDRKVRWNGIIGTGEEERGRSMNINQVIMDIGSFVVRGNRNYSQWRGEGHKIHTHTEREREEENSQPRSLQRNFLVWILKRYREWRKAVGCGGYEAVFCGGDGQASPKRNTSKRSVFPPTPSFGVAEL